MASIPSFREAFSLLKCSVQPGSLPHCMPSISIGSLGSLWLGSPPAIPDSKVQWAGMEEKELTVLSAGHEHLKSSGASLQFWCHSWTKYFHSLFWDYYFSFFSYHWENKSLTLVPLSSSAATACGILCFPAYCDYLAVIRIRPESKSECILPLGERKLDTSSREFALSHNCYP